MTVYVLHIEPAFKHAKHYIGYTPDATAARRINEHLNIPSKASPLITHALRAGCTVTLAHEYPGAGRDFERYLKSQGGPARWCGTCGIHKRPVLTPDRMPQRFRDAKPVYRRTCEDTSHDLPF